MPRSIQVFGEDSLQATWLAMQHLASELYTLGSPPGDHVFWHEPGDDLGLPYSDAIAPLAESRTRHELDART